MNPPDAPFVISRIGNPGSVAEDQSLPFVEEEILFAEYARRWVSEATRRVSSRSSGADSVQSASTGADKISRRKRAFIEWRLVESSFSGEALAWEGLDKVTELHLHEDDGDLMCGKSGFLDDFID